MARVPHPIKSSHAAMSYREPFMVRVGRYAMTGGLIVGLLVVLYVIAWFTTSMSLRSGLQDWFSARKAEGYLATYDDKQARISGFPFRVRASLNGVTLAPPKNETGKRAWVWSPKQIDFLITPLPWTVGTLNVEVSSYQALSVGGRNYEGKAKEMSLALDWISEGVPDDLGFKLAGANFEDKESGKAFQVKTLSMVLERLDSGNYAYDINGERIGLPVGVAGMGKVVPEIILRGELTENFGENGLGASQLASWRDAGGTLESKRVHIAYGPLVVQGNGTMALDGDLQLVGAFSARIQGFFDTLDRLRQAGVVRGADASMAKVVLGMLSKQPSNGGPATISLPLTIQERALFAGPVRLTAMPEIHW